VRLLALVAVEKAAKPVAWSIQAAAINMPTENNEDGNDAYAIASQRALQRFAASSGS